MQRLKRFALNQLPYHPQYLDAGTVYAAALRAPLSLGTVTPTPMAPAGTSPGPGSVISARLVTPLESGTTPRGAAVAAMVTEPVFASDGRLILPEGAMLAGTVTFSRKARRLHRNGTLRFLIEHVEAPEYGTSALLASLYSVDIGHDAHLTLDEEGGARVASPTSRFIAPALSALALSASMRADEVPGDEGGSEAGSYTTAGGRALTGLVGFGAAGLALSQVSRPVSVGIGLAGLARSVYTTVLGRGRDVVFAADTPIQVQLAPGPSPRR
jgi:hypothetical protein